MQLLHSPSRCQWLVLLTADYWCLFLQLFSFCLEIFMPLLDSPSGCQWPVLLTADYWHLFISTAILFLPGNIDATFTFTFWLPVTSIIDSWLLMPISTAILLLPVNIDATFTFTFWLPVTSNIDAYFYRYSLSAWQYWCPFYVHLLAASD